MLRGTERNRSRLARRTVVPIAGAIALVLAAACGDAGVPSGVSESATEDLGVRSSQTDRPPEVSTVPVFFLAFNPCTEAVEEFTGTATLRLQEFFLPDQTGRGHRLVRVTEDLETSSGFSGISTSTIVFNGIPGSPPEQAVFQGEQTVQLSDASGRRLVVQLLIHATFVGGDFVVEFESINERCVGQEDA